MPDATYTVFDTPPSNSENLLSNIQGVWNYIYNEWFQKSGYEMAEGKVDFEYYDESCMTSDKKIYKICIPVVKKS